MKTPHLSKRAPAILAVLGNGTKKHIPANSVIVIPKKIREAGNYELITKFTDAALPKKEQRGSLVVMAGNFAKAVMKRVENNEPFNRAFNAVFKDAKTSQKVHTLS